MDPGPSGSSTRSVAKQVVCVCRQYCKGQARLLSQVTFYHHLAEAEQDEYHTVEAVKAVSLDAARMILACRNTSNDPPNQSVSKASPS